VTSRTLTFGSTSYPLVLPTIRDPRLHVAMVIITIHVLGQVGLHFHVTVPQILAAILCCAVIEVALTFRETRSFVWPASAMLTGSGVALILRVVGTPADDPWNPYAWWVFAIVAGLSLLTKYVIRYRGSHVFNPSNLGLVVTFIVLGSSLVEPLDFWWAPLDPPMILAYVVILVGGVLISRRLHLLMLAATFYAVFAVGMTVLAASGHCMTANWAFAPVCGAEFVRVLVVSPEVLIFLLFMITDPRTAPRGQVARVAFGTLVAILSTLLIAPQTNEYGTKVALLAGLVVACAARPVLERVFPEPRSVDDDLRGFARRLLGDGQAGSTWLRRGARVGLATVLVVTLGAGVVVAGTPARAPAAPDLAELLGGMPHAIDPATLPTITVDVPAWGSANGTTIAQGILVTLGEDLQLERDALLRSDGSLLTAVDHGDRLAEMQARLAEARAEGKVVVERYHFDDAKVVAIKPFGVQTGGSIGFESHGTMTEETYDAGGTLLERHDAPFALTFAVRQPFGDRWMIVGVFPIGSNETSGTSGTSGDPAPGGSPTKGTPTAAP
jgi:Na+-translocating ferredoxin:NAD+ oxidoreductase RnfD subunit